MLDQACACEFAEICIIFDCVLNIEFTYTYA